MAVVVVEDDRGGSDSIGVEWFNEKETSEKAVTAAHIIMSMSFTKCGAVDTRKVIHFDRNIAFNCMQ